MIELYQCINLSFFCFSKDIGKKLSSKRGMANKTNVLHKFELQGRFLIVIVQTLNENSMMWTELVEIIYGCQITMLDFFMNVPSRSWVFYIECELHAQRAKASLSRNSFFFLS